MACGAEGEKLVKQIIQLSNVMEIIVFCWSVDFHKKWAASYASKIKLVTNSPEEIAQHLLPL